MPPSVPCPTCRVTVRLITVVRNVSGRRLRVAHRLIDLSHPLEPGMPAYPGLPVPQFGTHFTHDESAARRLYRRLSEA